MKTTITSTKKEEEPVQETKKEPEEKKEKSENSTQPPQAPQNYSCFPMMMFPFQFPNTTGGTSMPIPTQNAEGQPIMYMMPVCFCDPSKLPKDMKMPTMQYPFYPYPMPFQQNTPETK